MTGKHWIDMPRARVIAINTALTDAHEAFNRAYFESDTAGDLARNVAETMTALRRVEAILADEPEVVSW